MLTLNSLFISAIIFAISRNVIAEKCFGGTDELFEITCQKCQGLPVELLLILDDSSSIKGSYVNGGFPYDQFPTEIDFAKRFIKNVDNAFGNVSVGAVFFSECMAGYFPSWLTSTYVSNGVRTYRETAGRGLDCRKGTQQSQYSLQTPEDMLKVLDDFDNTGHWGTPLSVGYDFAKNIMQSSTPGRLRVVVMISDGEPTRPNYVPGPISNADTQLKKWEKVERCDKNVSDIKELGYISMTIEVRSGVDAQAGRNMLRWASFPRRTWALQVDNIDNLADLLAPIDDILCFYITELSTTKSSDPTGVCVQTGDIIEVRGYNLFDMVQDMTPINSAGTALSEGTGFAFPSPYSLTMIRIKTRDPQNQGAKLQIKPDNCADDAGWINLDDWAIGASTAQFSRNLDQNNGWYLWERVFDHGKNKPPVNVKCIRLYSSGPVSSGIDEILIFGKGEISKKPLCSFTSKDSDVFFSEARVIGENGTQFNCPMPETNGKYGFYRVEVNREGSKTGAFTNNGRLIKHTDKDCKSPPMGPTPKSIDNTLPNGETFAPTKKYYYPTPKVPDLPDVNSAQSLNVFLIFALFFISVF